MQPTNVEENNAVDPTFDDLRTAVETIAEADRIQSNLAPGRASSWDGTTAVEGLSCHRPCRLLNVGGAKEEAGVSQESEDAKLTGTATGSGAELQSLEQVLACAEYVPLRRSDAMDDFLRWRGGGGSGGQCATDKDAVKDVGAPDQRRTLPLCYVVGPSSADRTHFALQNLKAFHNHAGLPSVLVHWPLWMWHVPNSKVDNATASGGSTDDRKAASDLVRCFGELLAYRIQSAYDRKWNPRTTPLKLHLCLVLDVNDDHPEQIQFFTNTSSVDHFVKTLEESYLAESILVVMCAPRNVARHVDAFVFRLDGDGASKR